MTDRFCARTRFTARTLLMSIVLMAAAAVVLGAHDLFLKPDAFFVPAGDSVRVRVLNGTFTTSEGAVDRARLLDLVVVGPNGPSHPDLASWVPRGKETEWRVGTGASGTYLLGASLMPRTLRLDAASFNQYLQEEGGPDILAQRRASGELDQPARERYSKHVKALVQVGESRGARFDQVLGYPAELVPLDDPYRLTLGAMLRVRALVDGSPQPNIPVMAGGHSATGVTIPEEVVRTDAEGVARIPLRLAGVWYVKFIQMRRAAAGDSVDYESKWATLTFALR